LFVNDKMKLSIGQASDEHLIEIDGRGYCCAPLLILLFTILMFRSMSVLPFISAEITTPLFFAGETAWICRSGEDVLVNKGSIPLVELASPPQAVFHAA
jgi:hypothetical protein